MRTIYRLYRFTGYTHLSALAHAIWSRARNMHEEEWAYLFVMAVCIGWMVVNVWRAL